MAKDGKESLVVGSPLKESFQGINLGGGSNGAVDWTHAD
jgi:hypothetical protein